MNKIFLTVCLFFVLVFATGCNKKRYEQERICSRIDLEKIVDLFPTTSQAIELMAQEGQDAMTRAIEEIKAVKAQDRNYHNTILMYEQAYMLFFTKKQILTTLALFSDDAQLQLAANLAVHEMDQYKIQNLDTNAIIYRAFGEYQTHGKDVYHVSKSVQHFIASTRKKMKWLGVTLPEGKQEELLKLKKEDQLLNGQFYRNIIVDAPHIVVKPQDLDGVSSQTLAKLHKNQDGDYVVTSEEAIFFDVMENCHVLKTRKAYHRMNGNLAYAANTPVLKSMMTTKHQIAKILGYSNFADYQYQELMMKSSKKVQQFLWDVVRHIEPYVMRDYKKMLRQLPAGVILDHRNMLQPWDDAYVKSQYRKKVFHVDDVAMAQYFPVDYVVTTMIQQFEKIFHVTMQAQQLPENALWAKDLQAYQVRSLKTQAIIGYLFLDLYQRPGKNIADACHHIIVPAVSDDCSIACAGASAVVARFAKSENNKPTLLQFSDVLTLFHEMGHGLHSLFGATRFTAFSGTQVVQDFVETPSIMLEYFFDQPDMLKAISCHVDTKKPLSQPQIEQLIAAQKFGRAGRLLKQVYLALLSLHVFKDSPEQNLNALNSYLYKKVFHNVVFDPEYHVLTSFAHLAQPYAAAYYAYPLSTIIAADLFVHFRYHGFSNYKNGIKYISDILMPGGSTNPHIMIKKYLGRQFGMSAYLSLL